MTTPGTCSGGNSCDLKPGDTALAIEVLTMDANLRRIAARDYRGHPAADTWERNVNEIRALNAERSAKAIDRVILRLTQDLAT